MISLKRSAIYQTPGSARGSHQLGSFRKEIGFESQTVTRLDLTVFES
jgi:hypothetical protein